MKILIAMSILFGLVIADTLIKKRISGEIKVERKQKSKVEKWLGNILFCFIVINYILLEFYSPFNVLWALLFSIIFALLNDIYMDWKYAREAKSHIVSFFTYPFILALIIGLFTFI